jgi:hypothetical protein
LLNWANTAHKALPGHVTFFEADRRTARETLSFQAGKCVGYHEAFTAGNISVGAYVCQAYAVARWPTQYLRGCYLARLCVCAASHGGEH